MNKSTLWMRGFDVLLCGVKVGALFRNDPFHEDPEVDMVTCS